MLFKLNKMAVNSLKIVLFISPSQMACVEPKDD